MSSKLKQNVALLSLLILTGGCSHYPTASGSLPVEPASSQMSSLKALELPQGVSLPPEITAYQIPPKPSSSKIDAPLDLRPPVQPLALLPGSEAYYREKQAILQLEQTADIQYLWRQLKQWLVRQGITITSHDDRQHTLMTSWTPVDNQEGKKEFSARYRFSLSSTVPAKLTSELLFLGKSIETPQASQKPAEMGKKIATASEQRYYSVSMLNRLMTDLTQKKTAVEAAPQGLSSPKN